MALLATKGSEADSVAEGMGLPVATLTSYSELVVVVPDVVLTTNSVLLRADVDHQRLLHLR
jgi:hypothetical protein